MKRLVFLLAAAALLGGCLASAPVGRGNQALSGGDYATASAAYAEAVRLEPEKWRVRVRYGYALMQSGETAAALEQFATTLKYQGHTPDRHWAVFYAGLCEARLGRAKRAVAYWGGYSNVHWTLTSVVREAASSLVADTSRAGAAFADQTLERMEHAQAVQELDDRIHILKPPGRTHSYETADPELQPWDKQRKSYLP